MEEEGWEGRGVTVAAAEVEGQEEPGVTVEAAEEVASHHSMLPGLLRLEPTQEQAVATVNSQVGEEGMELHHQQVEQEVVVAVETFRANCKPLPQVVEEALGVASVAADKEEEGEVLAVGDMI